jgi:hypothetical protein
VTREVAERARLELAARDIDPDLIEHSVTAEEWLDAHRAEQADSEPHRAITDADLDTRYADRDTDLGAQDQATVARHEAGAGSEAAAEAELAEHAEVVAETEVPDVREVAGIELPVEDNVEDWDRVPDVDETAGALDRARVARGELDQREAWQAQREAEDRTAQLAYWHAEEQTRAEAQDIVQEPELEKR